MSEAERPAVPLPKKLGIKPDSRLLLVNAPHGFLDLLGPLPTDVTLAGPADTGLDLILFFTTSRSDLSASFSVLAASLAPAGLLWVAWPKQASGAPTDLTFEIVQATGLAAGLVDTKIAAIDPTWSALRFVIPLQDRPVQSGKVQ